MIVWIMTDMEGLAGIDRWEHCYDPDDDSPVYRYGREQLTLDANAAISGCFDAGADDVRILDGHGRNHNKGFVRDLLDPRARIVWFAGRDPVRWEGLDESVTAVAMVGQHAMAGTMHAFIDHTQAAKDIVRYRIDGQEQGEMGQMALYAGAVGAPLVHVSGDDALCREAERLFPGTACTPTKRGTGFLTCELYPPDEVRSAIRRDIAAALLRPLPPPWRPDPPIRITVEWAWCEPADRLGAIPGVRRLDARTVEWEIADARDVFTWPSERWQPLG